MRCPVLLALAVGVGLVGCGGAPREPAPAAPQNVATRPATAPGPTPAEEAHYLPPPPPVFEDPHSPMIGQPLPHLPPSCTSRALALDDFDLDGDGAPEMRKYSDHATKVVRCKLLDFNDDQRWDVAMELDATGAVILELRDTDFDSRWDAATVPPDASGIARTFRDVDADGVIDKVTW